MTKHSADQLSLLSPEELAALAAAKTETVHVASQDTPVQKGDGIVTINLRDDHGRFSGSTSYDPNAVAHK